MKKNIAFLLSTSLLLIHFLSFSQWSLTGNSSTTPGTNFLGTTDNQHLFFNTNSSVRMRLLNNGNLLLGGATDNGYLFDVNGTSVFRNNLTVDYGTTNRRIQLRDNGLYMSRTSDGSYISSITANGEMVFNTRNHYRFYSNSVEYFTIYQDGNIGVGVSIPTSRLHVNGTIRAPVC